MKPATYGPVHAASMSQILADTSLQQSLVAVTRQVATGVVDREYANLFAADPRFSYRYALLEGRSAEALDRIIKTPVRFRSDLHFQSPNVLAAYSVGRQIIGINSDSPIYYQCDVGTISNAVPLVIATGVHELLHAAETCIPDHRDKRPRSWLATSIEHYIDLKQRRDPNVRQIYKRLLQDSYVIACCRRLKIDINQPGAIEKMIAVQFTSWSEYITEYLTIEGINISYANGELNQWFRAEDLPHLPEGSLTPDHIRTGSEKMTAYESVIRVAHGVLNMVFAAEPQFRTRYDALYAIMKSGMYFGYAEGVRRPWTILDAFLAEKESEQAPERVFHDDIEGIISEKLFNAIESFGFETFVLFMAVLPTCRDVV